MGNDGNDNLEICNVGRDTDSVWERNNGLFDKWIPFLDLICNDAIEIS